MFIFLIWLQLVIFSLVLGSMGSSGQKVRVLVYTMSSRSVAYTFGVIHRQFDAVSTDGATRWLIDRVTIGFILVAIECEFYKLHEDESSDVQNTPSPGV
jgi:hypothetical protein